MKGHILLISGPSGAGKSTLLSRLMKEYKHEIYFSISCTTREPRVGELDGVNYHFISEEDFKKGIENDNFLEWARVHNHYYGSPKDKTLKAMAEGKTVIFDIDVQGFFLVKEQLKDDFTSVFITTLDKNELKKRLIKRNTDTIANIEKRLQNAKDEIEHLNEYDYLIINEDLEQSYQSLKTIFEAQKQKIKRKDINHIKLQWNKGE